MNHPDTFTTIAFDVPAPYTEVRTVADSDIDRLGHTNNVVYLGWLESVAWAHSVHLGLDWDLYQRINACFVARRHTLDYLRPTFVGDELHVATWITDNPGRVTMDRAYQIVRAADGVTVLRGTTQWACVDLTTGRPRRMPPEFAEGFVAVSPT
ncbi:thioesterase family protein [uncultured Abyssibacter sp.]|uniref:acyl-CoA thioesterase n=1 Tax=uncultured Abyssibacter sp. TaxID=2320202 RepID=UPI0032B233BE